MEKPKILILYMPVIHEGYFNIFRSNHFEEILILDKGVIDFLIENGFEYLSRDLRCLHSETIIQLMNPLFGAKALHLEDLQNGKLKQFQIHIQDDEIGRFVFEKFFSDKEDVIWESSFLRWHKEISTAHHEIVPDVAISEDDLDKAFMILAEKEAQKSSDWWRQVGCVLKLNNPVLKLLKSFNYHMPHEHITEMEGNSRIDFGPGERIDLVTSIHAEASLIAKAAKDGVSVNDAYLYVTTFPCPVCARLIVEAGISKVFYRDGYSLFDGQRILKEGNVEIILVK